MLATLAALVLLTAPLAESRGPTEHRTPVTVQGESVPSPAPGGAFLPADKLLHVLVTSTAMQLTAAGLRWLGAPFWAAHLVGLTVGVVVGAGKELLDLFGGGTPEVGDLAADGAGLLLGSVLILSGAF